MLLLSLLTILSADFLIDSNLRYINELIYLKCSRCSLLPIAGLIIDELYAKDCYIVRGTVRDLSNETKVAHLKAQWPDIQLFEADLLKENSFDTCFEGIFIKLH